MITDRLRLTGFLLLLGCGWGLTQPLIKITVTAGYQPLGLVKRLTPGPIHTAIAPTLANLLQRLVQGIHRIQID